MRKDHRPDPSQVPTNDEPSPWDSRVERFRQACHQPNPPSIGDLHRWVADSKEDERADLMIDLVAEHLRASWQQGERRRLEEYVASLGKSFPELASCEALPVDLVEHEFLVRHEFPATSDHPGIDEYRGRFPGRSDVEDRLRQRCLDGGRYVRTQIIGTGGLGQVCEAFDQRLGRYVAIKSARWELADHPEVLARLAQEAAVTAGLEHPGIVTVHEFCSADEDVEADGPFYVMRLVKGSTLQETILAFHREKPGLDRGQRSLRWNALLQSFLDICSAMAYAHAQGVIHRDLKPGNVIIGEFGETVILDWGLAKRLTGRRDASGKVSVEQACAEAELQTATGPVGTSGFLAPEQARGISDARSDVYSLGAILHVMLNGAPPEMVPSLVSRGKTDAQGTRLSDGKLRRPDVPRPLEAICRRALAPAPENRYQSVRDLAVDVEHYLADEPVSAWREPWTVPLRRWTRRHRGAVGTGVVLIVLGLIGLGAFSIVLASKNQQLSTQTLRAERRAELAQRAIAGYVEAIENNLDVQNRPDLAPLRRALLHAPQHYYQELRMELQTDAAERPQTLEALADTVFSLAEITARLDAPEEALRHYEEVLKLRSQLLRIDPPGDRHFENLIKTCNNMGNLQRLLGHHEKALEEFDRGLRLLSHARDGRVRDMALVAIEVNRGAVLTTIDREAEALREFQRAREVVERLYEQTPRNEFYRAELAVVLTNLATIETDSKRAEGEIELLARARELRQGLVRDFPEDPNYRSALARTDLSLGKAYRIKGDYDRSRQSFESVCADLDPLVRDYGSVAMYRYDYSKALQALANLDRRTGDHAAALRNLVHARQLLQVLAEDFPLVPSYRSELASSDHELGEVERQMGRPREAAEHYRRAIEARERLVREHPDVTLYREGLIATSGNLGLALMESGKREEAVPYFHEVSSSWDELVRANPTNRTYRLNHAKSFANLGETYNRLGDREKAIEFQRKALEAFQRLATEDPDNAFLQSFTGIAYHNLGSSLSGLARPAEALEASSQAIEFQMRALEKVPSSFQFRRQLSNHYLGLAWSLRKLGRPAEAVEATLERSRLWPTDPQEQFLCACDLCLCIPLFGKGKEGSELTREERGEHQRCAELALAALRRAIECGFHDADALRRRPEWTVLRGSAAFEALVLDLSFPKDPFAP